MPRPPARLLLPSTTGLCGSGGRRLHYFLPCPDASKIACLWQAPTVDDVKALVEPAFGAVSKNDFFEVDAEKAAGLPA